MLFSHGDRKNALADVDPWDLLVDFAINVFAPSAQIAGLV